MTRDILVRRLRSSDVEAARELNALFAEAFDDYASYASTPPTEGYLRRVLSREGVIALVAVIEGRMAGALVGYVLDKLEQERSEIYIYDLAVSYPDRRRGVATALIAELQRIATEIGAWVVYVQADLGDEPATALYEKLGTREEVLHFDIPPAITR